MLRIVRDLADLRVLRVGVGANALISTGARRRAGDLYAVHGDPVGGEGDLSTCFRPVLLRDLEAGQIAAQIAEGFGVGGEIPFRAVRESDIEICIGASAERYIRFPDRSQLDRLTVRSRFKTGFPVVQTVHDAHEVEADDIDRRRVLVLAEAEALRLEIGVGDLTDIIGHACRWREAQRAFTLIVGNRLRVGSVKERAAVEEAFLDLLGQVEVRRNVQRLSLAVAAVYKRELAALVDYDGRERHAVLLAVKLFPGERPGEVGRAEAAAELDRAVIKVCHVLFVRGAGERLVLAVGIAGVEKVLYVRSTVRREAGRILYDRVGLSRFHVQKIVRQDEIKGNDGTGRAVAKALFSSAKPLT